MLYEDALKERLEIVAAELEQARASASRVKFLEDVLRGIRQLLDYEERLNHKHLMKLVGAKHLVKLGVLNTEVVYA